MHSSLKWVAAVVVWIFLLVVTSGYAAWGPFFDLVDPLIAVLILWAGIIGFTVFGALAYMRSKKAEQPPPPRPAS